MTTKRISHPQHHSGDRTIVVPLLHAASVHRPGSDWRPLLLDVEVHSICKDRGLMLSLGMIERNCNEE